MGKTEPWMPKRRREVVYFFAVHVVRSRALSIHIEAHEHVISGRST